MFLCLSERKQLFVHDNLTLVFHGSNSFWNFTIMAVQHLVMEISQPSTTAGLHKVSCKFWSPWVLGMCMRVCACIRRGAYVCICVCVCAYTANGKRLGSGFECKTCDHPSWSMNSSLALFWTAPTSCLQDESSQEGPSQSVPNDFWFSSRDTAIACAIATLDYCVLNGPEVQIKYWVSRKKLGSVFKNKDVEWWLYGRGPVSQTKAFGAIWDPLRYQTCPVSAGKHSTEPMGDLLLAWKPGTHWAILQCLQSQKGCMFRQPYHTLIH